MKTTAVIVLKAFTVLILSGAALVAVAVYIVHAQERSAFQTRQWTVGVITYSSLENARVDVIETEGVCLYVAVAGIDPRHRVATLAAVPKTQLPKGTGCQ